MNMKTDLADMTWTQTADQDPNTNTDMDTGTAKGKDMNMFMVTDNLNRQYTKNQIIESVEIL